ncbi:hypothetical protein BD324DRAFT_650589 [Kockovaella imperatae]|uniref:Formyl transferase C-terminal domain-containing protein n=1 Tax=Kockovaella imperatae TaxID=4999 RepID=A0A1Y1UKQ7_9TREE|nr:hypothetical protein BD324DRAFT_650589 [Kockovaella imperatae]ORX38056.1 hypothetical protein BD324DRAFT_650589 [Kockovaella imperatae]
MSTDEGPSTGTMHELNAEASTSSTTRLSNLDAPLGPLSSLPASSTGLQEWKILLLCTAVNSFSQRVITYFDFLGLKNVSVQIASNDEAMISACEEWDPDMVVCPFLTRVIPERVFGRWTTLVVHPGPPGDAGPSSLDWVLLGDNGSDADSTSALNTLLNTSSTSWSGERRSHWGTIVFQANEHLDGGAIWAWEQYELPTLGTLTKAQLYQTLHSQGAISALITAMIRVYETTSTLPKDQRVSARPREEWQKLSVTSQLTFQGGSTHERPLIQSKLRKPDFAIHTATDVQRIIYASDSQPGAQLAPLTGDSKTSLFAYGAHLHLDAATVPKELYTCLGYESMDQVPDGRILAHRHGAIFVKTRSTDPEDAAGVWITHGRVPKKAGTPLEPKVPMVQAIESSGHASALQGVQEWSQETFDHVPGTWQEVYVKSIHQGDRLAQCVYWNFYNGAFSTRQCQLLLKACQWAVEPERGNVKALALMGGSYFSNGIALNTIEASAHPGQETWANISAIDDIVEFLVSDTSADRSPFMRHVEPLCERGIVTVACVRSNAAAGGVALAAGCDVVMAGRGVVLNPAYRAMGLHGSEFHSYSYLTRCGESRSAAMLRDMMPQSSTQSRETGLVDIEIGSCTSTSSEIESLCIEQIKTLLQSSSTQPLQCAPWSTFTSDSTPPSIAPSVHISLTDWMCKVKRDKYRHRSFPPLVHFRTEELSQMLLDSFHSIRSKRYHERRYKFIRKVKSDATPSRYIRHRQVEQDEEEREEFDDAPGWTRGEEWSWADLPIPASLATSEKTRVPLYSADDNAPRKASIVVSHVESDTCTAVESSPNLEAEAGTPDKSLLRPIEPMSTPSTENVSFTALSSPGSMNQSLPSDEDDTVRTPSPRQSTFFKKQGRRISSSSQFASMVNTPLSTPAVTPDGPLSGSKSKASGRFKSFSKRLSGAFTLKPPPPSRPSILPPAQTFKTQAVQNGPKLQNVTAATRASMTVVRSPKPTIPGHRATLSTSLPPSSTTTKSTYQSPKIKGAEQCDFPCLYEPTEVKKTTNHAVNEPIIEEVAGQA